MSATDYNRITFKKVMWDKYWNKGYVKRKKDSWIFALIIKYSGLKKEHRKFVDYSIPLKKNYPSTRGTYGLERINIDSDKNIVSLTFYNGRMSCPVIIICHPMNNEDDLKELGTIVKVLNSEVSREHDGWGSNLGNGTYEYVFTK